MTFNNKRKRGDFIGSFAPYGYNKQRDIKNVVHLIVDPVASNTVKRIFNEYVSGKSLRAISRDLNNDNVKTQKLSNKSSNKKIKIELDNLKVEYKDLQNKYNILFEENEEYKRIFDDVENECDSN